MSEPVALSGTPRSLPRGAATRLAVLGGAFVLFLAPFARALPSEKSQWHRIETASHEILSDAGPKRAVWLGGELERFRSALAAMTNSEPRGGARVFIFRNEKSFRPYMPRYDGEVRKVGGLYIWRDHRAYILLDADSPDHARKTVYHELVHAHLREALPSVAPWLNEGLAEFMETFRASGDEVEIGHPQERHLKRLHEEGLMPLSELLAVEDLLKGHWEGHERFYAQSWALVHYLMTTRPGGREALGRYTAAARGGQRPELVAILGTTVAGLQQELTRHVRSPSLAYFRFRLVAESADESVTRARAPRVEVLSALGDMLLHWGSERASEAGAHLEAALALAAKDARTLSSLARLAEAAGDYELAAKRHEEAVKNAAEDGDVLFAAARFRLARAGGHSILRRDASDSARAAILAMRELAARAAKADPELAGALALHGLSYFAEDEELAEGIASLERATALRPGRADWSSWLVQLLARAGDRGRASRELRRLERLGDEARIKRARTALGWADVRQARNLLETGALTKARGFVERNLKTAEDEQLRAELERILALVQQRIEAE